MKKNIITITENTFIIIFAGFMNNSLLFFNKFQYLKLNKNII